MRSATSTPAERSISLQLRRITFWLLAWAALLFLPAFVASALEIRTADLGYVYDRLLVFSFLAHALLVLWMFVATVRDKDLTARERRRWLLLLPIGGGITASVYLWLRLYDYRS